MVTRPRAARKSLGLKALRVLAEGGYKVTCGHTVRQVHRARSLSLALRFSGKMTLARGTLVAC